MKIILITLITISTIASSGSGGNGLGRFTNFQSSGSGGLGLSKVLGGSGSGGQGLDIVNYYDNLKPLDKEKAILELPKNIKIINDRDFISPINRWTLKTKSRDLLTKDSDSMKSYDELKFFSEYYDKEVLKDELKKTKFKLQDFVD